MTSVMILDESDMKEAATLLLDKRGMVVKGEPELKIELIDSDSGDGPKVPSVTVRATVEQKPKRTRK